MLRIYETDCAALAPYWDEALALLPPERRQRVQTAVTEPPRWG